MFLVPGSQAEGRTDVASNHNHRLSGGRAGSRRRAEKDSRAKGSRGPGQSRVSGVLDLQHDLPKGLVEAKSTGKPLIVILRCIPCEECVKLDDELMDNDPQVRPLLDKFVRVRIVGTNGLDLSLFQFDTDQSFTAFLLNATGRSMAVSAHSRTGPSGSAMSLWKGWPKLSKGPSICTKHPQAS